MLVIYVARWKDRGYRVGSRGSVSDGPVVSPRRPPAGRHLRERTGPRPGLAGALRGGKHHHVQVGLCVLARLHFFLCVFYCSLDRRRVGIFIVSYVGVRLFVAIPLAVHPREASQGKDTLQTEVRYM